MASSGGMWVLAGFRTLSKRQPDTLASTKGV